MVTRKFITQLRLKVALMTNDDRVQGMACSLMLVLAHKIFCCLFALSCSHFNDF